MPLQPLRQNIELSAEEIRMLRSAMIALFTHCDPLPDRDRATTDSIISKLIEAVERMRAVDNSVPWTDPDQNELPLKK
jgi:hypothetical protein